MPSSVNCAGLFWTGGMTWTAEQARQLLGSLVTADTGPGTVPGPRGGVLTGAATSMQVTAGTGMAVKVAAGYCTIPHPTLGQGAYVMGLMAQATLNPATADPAHGRIDLVVARIYDLESSGSYCDVEMVTGTPASSPLPPTAPAGSLVLAQVAIPAAATAPGTITDERAWTAPPGGILPIANAAAAPAAPPTQVCYNLATGKLCRGTGTAGQTQPIATVAAPVMSVVNTSTGAEGLTPGGQRGGSPVHWGIGYGWAGSYNDTDGVVAREIQVPWTADGVSDYEIAYKWQLAIGAEEAGGNSVIRRGQVLYLLSVDGTVVDQVAQFVDDAASIFGDGGMATWFTSGALGTTPAKGPHTATLSVVTSGTLMIVASGVIVGDMAQNGNALLGAPSGWCANLDSENCYVAVVPVPAS